MKLLRYGDEGKEKPGCLDAYGAIRDLSGVVDDIAGDWLSPASLAQLAEIDPVSLPRVGGVPRLGPCVGRVSKLIGVGLNYADHAREIGAEPPQWPVLFFKPPSSICGPNDDIVLPPDADKLDWEVELGVVIGTIARRVPRERALDHVAGYCVVNDITERGWIERSGQMLDGKSGDRFTPTGPFLVTRDEVPDIGDLALHLELNGEPMQAGSTRTMIFDLPFIVSHLSRLMTLLPGDIVTTGTPPGVGMRRSPPRYLRAGDVMTLGIAGLGEQRQSVMG